VFGLPILLAVIAQPARSQQCVDFYGLQFCAALVSVPSPGERATITLTTRNISSKPIVVLDLAKVPIGERELFVSTWDLTNNVKCEPTGRKPTRESWYTSLAPGKATSARILSACAAFKGANSFLFGVPYSWDLASTASPEFFRSLWNPPTKTSPLIGPLRFTTHQ
jgi:hypothetical protein